MAGDILIYRMGAFGDTLLLSLLFKQLAAHNKNIRIALAANPTYAAPLLDAGLVHEILNGGAAPFHLLYSERPSENDVLSPLIKRYDKCAFYTADRSGELANRLNLNRLKQCYIHPPFPPEEENVHVSEWMTRPWPSVGTSDLGNMKLKASRNSLVLAHNILNKHDIEASHFFIMHSGGGSEKKWAPPEILTRIGREHAEETGHQPVLVEGPADPIACKEFQKFWGEPIRVIKDTLPKPLSALLSTSSAYIGGDSGVSHLASLYAPRTMILYGPHSDMGAWRPIGSHTKCVPWEMF